MQVGAYLWHKGPAGGLSGLRSHNLSTLACLEVQVLPLNYLLLLIKDYTIDTDTSDKNKDNNIKIKQ